MPIDETLDPGLSKHFISAMAARRSGNVDRAAELLRKILKEEPRLAEPRMELAGLLMETGQPEEAASEASEAVRILEAGGQWTEDLPENVVLSLAYSILGEALRKTLDNDDVVFGDPEVWKEKLEASQRALKRASELDAGNDHAQYWSWNPENEE